MERSLGITAPQRLVLRCVGKFPGVSAGRLATLLHLVDRAIGRVLLAVHPGLAADVDRAAVETIYLVTRHLEHAGLHPQLAARLRAGGHENRAVARALILF